MNEFLKDEDLERCNSQGIADTLRRLREEYGFDQETCDELAQLPYEEAFEEVCGYLASVELDHEEILADFIVYTI